MSKVERSGEGFVGGVDSFVEKGFGEIGQAGLYPGSQIHITLANRCI
jgi:hypothetical protein